MAQMPKRGAGTNSEHAQTEMGWVAGLTVAAVFTWFVWYAWRWPIVYVVFALKWLELEAVALVHGGLEPGGPGEHIKKYIEDTFEPNAIWNPSETDFNDMHSLMTAVGMQSRLGIGIIIIGLAVWIVLRMRGEGVKTRYDLSRFMNYQSGFFRVVLTGAKFDPAATDTASDPAKTPVEWLRDEGVEFEDDKLDEAAATRAFSKQLGEVYNGLEKGAIDKQPPYIRALAVMFGMSRVRDKRTQAFKERLAEIWLQPRAVADKETAEYIAPFLAEKKLYDSITKRAAHHAYVNTMMIGLFEWAKDAKDGGGVLPCAEIRWLKPIDRLLWYSLENTGRHAYFIEGAGSRAHYFAEFVTHVPRIEIYVDEAMHGIQEYMKTQFITSIKAHDRDKLAKD